jgi:hypothetical protein
LAEDTCAIAGSDQNSRSIVIVIAVIFTEAPHAVSLVLSESIVSCQSPHV